MNIVFIHQNFPGQFRHIASALASDPENRVISISQEHAPKLKSVRNISYKPARNITKGIHPYLESSEAHVLNGQAVARVLLALKRRGFRPDVIFAHTGWGEALYVKDIFQDVPLVGFFEFFYRARGADVCFDPEYPLDLDGTLRVRTRTAIHLLSLDACNFGITPTRWQRSVFPGEYWPKLNVIHEGIDTDRVIPKPDTILKLPNGETLRAGSEVITYVARNLEPYRGFHMFMRTTAEICRRRPRAHIVIVGGDDVSYGARLPPGDNYRKRMLMEVEIDHSRVHFLGRIPYEDYLSVLQVSSAHVYLTVPFVLSWSMLEAMSAGCLVIGSDTPPVREVIRHGENGLLVDFFSPKSLADTIDQVLDHPEHYQKMRQAGRETIIKDYSLRQGLEEYLRLISTTINHSVGGHLKPPVTQTG